MIQLVQKYIIFLFHYFLTAEYVISQLRLQKTSLPAEYCVFNLWSWCNNFLYQYRFQTISLVHVKLFFYSIIPPHQNISCVISKKMFIRNAFFTV